MKKWGEYNFFVVWKEVDKKNFKARGFYSFKELAQDYMYKILVEGKKKGKVVEVYLTTNILYKTTFSERAKEVEKNDRN